MKVIFYDLMQLSDAADELKSPSLADTWTAATSATINITVTPEVPGGTLDAIGVGNTDAASVTINGETVILSSDEKNGLYQLTTPIELGADEDFYLLTEAGETILTETGEPLLVESLTYSVTISHDGTYMGRLALGKYHALYASPSHEPGFYTTAQPRVTVSGQVVEGAGGYTGRRISLDFRYKFTESMIKDIERAYDTQLSRGYPLFMWFDKESRMPWTRMYAATDSDILFQSAVNRYLYSRRMEFVERF